MKTDMEDSKAIVMNFRAASGDRYDASHMKFRLKRLRQLTGVSEQALIFRFLHLGWEACQDYTREMETIEREWREQCTLVKQ